MSEVKLPRFYARRYVAGEGLLEAELALRAYAAKHHGYKVWLEVEPCYEVVHIDEGDRHASALTSIYEVVVLP